MPIRRIMASWSLYGTILTHMAPDSGMAFVLVQHLDPHHLSLLPELLAPHIQMPVHMEWREKVPAPGLDSATLRAAQ